MMNPMIPPTARRAELFSKAAKANDIEQSNHHILLPIKAPIFTVTNDNKLEHAQSKKKEQPTCFKP